MSKLLAWLRASNPSAAPGQARGARVVQGTLAAFAGKGLGVAVGLLAIPLAVGALGPERYGVWVTLTTLLAWFQLADLGIGNGLLNAVAGARGGKHSDEARRHVATAFWILGALAAGMLLVTAAMSYLVDWSAVFHLRTPQARTEIAPALAVAGALFALSFPLSLLDRIYVALQEGALANGWATTASLASLLALVVVVETGGGLVALVAGFSGARLLVQAINAGWLFLRHRPDLAPRAAAIDRRSATALMRTGGLFFAVQAAALVLYETDNLIIARVLDARSVTPYSVAWRLFLVPAAPAIMVFPYLWAAYADAGARRDAPWIHASFRTSLAIGTISAAALCAPLLYWGRGIILRFAGPDALPPPGLLAWMAAWAVVQSFLNGLSCLLNSQNRIKGQAIYGAITAIVNVALSVRWARSDGITGVIAATVVACLACAVVPASIETWLTLRSLAAQADRERQVARPEHE